MGLSLTHEVLSLALRDPFRIARSDPAEDTRITTVIVELRDDRYPDVVGVGEGYPDRFYGETPETMAAVFPLLLAEVDAEALSMDLADAASARQHLAWLGAIWADRLRGHGAAKCALDIALHDFAGKLLGQPVHAFLGLSTELPPTDFTIGIDEPAVVAERAARAADFPALKIKCGGPADLATLRAVREVFSGPDPGRRQHRLDPGRRRVVAAGIGRSRRRADRAAIPGSRVSRPRLAPGALADADRGRRELRLP